jgi:DNA-binding NtrC family response regulator
MPPSPRQVVVVDDDALICQLLRAQLMTYRPSWVFRVFLDPQSALSHLRETPADAVVSDHDMPGGDGVWFLDQVRAGSPGACRILISGSLPDTLRDSGNEVHAVFCKPVDVARLIAEIESRPGLARS